MLSDEDLRHIDEGRFRAGVGFFTREEMRDFYERCIENGTLRVVETCEMTYSGSINEGDTSHPIFHHKGCPDDSGAEVLEARVGDDITTARANFCPGCGAKIK